MASGGVTMPDTITFEHGGREWVAEPCVNEANTRNFTRIKAAVRGHPFPTIDKYRAAREVLPRHADRGSRMKWLSIESAPRDGTTIMVRQGRWPPWHAFWSEGRWKAIEYHFGWEPSHWRSAALPG